MNIHREWICHILTEDFKKFRTYCWRRNKQSKKCLTKTVSGVNGLSLKNRYMFELKVDVMRKKWKVFSRIKLVGWEICSFQTRNWQFQKRDKIFNFKNAKLVNASLMKRQILSVKSFQKLGTVYSNIILLKVNVKVMPRSRWSSVSSTDENVINVKEIFCTTHPIQVEFS